MRKSPPRDRFSTSARTAAPPTGMDRGSCSSGSGSAPGPGPEGEQQHEGESLAPDGSSPDSPLAPAHFTYTRAPKEYRGGSSLPGLGDRAALCSHGSSLSPSPAPSQHYGAWKPPSVQHHVISVRQEQAFRMPKSCHPPLHLAGLLGGHLPDFSKPLLGFEPQDTDIGRKLVVWRALQTLTGSRKLLSLSPDLELNSSNPHPTLSPTPWSSAQEGMVRPRRMVEPLEDRGQENFFCGPPEKRYAQLVFMSTSAGSLWNLHAIHSMCHMEQDQVRSHHRFGALCQRTAANECCPSWSLGNYIAVLSNRSSCLDTTQADAARILALLRTCALYYHRGALGPPCLGPGQDKPPRCAQVPAKCSRSSAVYQLLHFLLDKDFLSPQTADYQVPSLKYSLLFLPTPKGASMMGIYLDHLATPWGLSDNYTSITGMDLGLKQELLRHYLAQDTVYPLLALAAIFLSIALYLRSFFLTLMVLLGSVCTNHTLIFSDLWRLSKSQLPSGGLVQRVGRTMHHFGYLLLVSGLTTSAAFYASYLSRLPAVRCFALYMGTAVLAHLALTLAWLPSSFVLHERYLARSCGARAQGPWAGSAPRRLALALHRRLRGLRRTAARTSRLLFQRLLPCGVIKFRYIWICWFTALAAGGAYIAGVSPRLRLPTLLPPRGQVFRPSHPFERFDAEYRQQFQFERLPEGEGGHMPVILVWGVLPVDTGDPLDPRSNSSLVSDPAFSASSPEAQRWLLALCYGARNQSFFGAQPEGWPTLCFVEALQRWMESPAMMALEQGPESTRDLGLRFNTQGSLTALVLQFQTSFQYSRNYSRAHHFYTEPAAQPEHRACVVLGLALALAFATLLLGTWNVPLSLFSVAAVAGTVLLTVGLLVLLEWQLNTAEVLFLSASVGLSVDFTVNYCISYHLCPHPDRLSRVAFSLRQTSRATAMGAAALFAAGVLMCLPRELFLDHQAVFSQCPACRPPPLTSRLAPAPSPRPGRTPKGRRLSPCRPHQKPQPQPRPKPKAAEPPDCLCSSASTLEGLSVSDETCLSTSEPSARVPDSMGASPEDLDETEQSVPERGQLNGKRDTLWLALKETVYDPSLPASHQSSSSWKGRGGPGDGSPVVLPNSQPDLPDVWLRRPSTHTSGYSS
ncbi:hypothetical protein QTO34_019591 [Cnephaeus nilssonii]|uniref:SSD domain-containing protein n=1 Tax=Cnephaeus nilssonii TaxID=3371016 RepID=A0AA40LP74_CNENI|nr:hypothetical protein QTO34_019591 [Eptesicus nilssonii]